MLRSGEEVNYYSSQRRKSQHCAGNRVIYIFSHALKNTRSLISEYRVSQWLMPVQQRNKTLIVAASEAELNARGGSDMLWTEYLCLLRIHMLKP